VHPAVIEGTIVMPQENAGDVHRRETFLLALEMYSRKYIAQRGSVLRIKAHRGRLYHSLKSNNAVLTSYVGQKETRPDSSEKPAEVGAVLVGITLVVSMRFKVSMAMFSEERTSF
jgi:hypothetical protein